MEYLVEHGADINKEDKDGRSPLFIACKIPNGSMVKYLVEHGANVNGIDLYESESESKSESESVYDNDDDIIY
jgi:ankyrin repeat protein